MTAYEQEQAAAQAISLLVAVSILLAEASELIERAGDKNAAAVLADLATVADRTHDKIQKRAAARRGSHVSD